MTHHVFTVDDADAKNDLVKHLASGTGRRILFMRTKHQAKKLAKQLTARASPRSTCTATCRSRSATATSPRSPPARSRVLVATDVAARGVHVDDVELVVHVDPPMEHKAYLHRSGRTARAGGEGAVVTVCSPRRSRTSRRSSARPRSR